MGVSAPLTGANVTPWMREAGGCCGGGAYHVRVRRILRSKCWAHSSSSRIVVEVALMFCCVADLKAKCKVRSCFYHLLPELTGCCANDVRDGIKLRTGGWQAVKDRPVPGGAIIIVHVVE